MRSNGDIQDCLDFCTQYSLMQAIFRFPDINTQKKKKNVSKRIESVNNVKPRNSKRKLEMVKKGQNYIVGETKKQQEIKTGNHNNYLEQNKQYHLKNYFQNTQNSTKNKLPYQNSNYKNIDISFKNSFQNTGKFNFAKLEQNQYHYMPKQTYSTNYQARNEDLYYMKSSYNRSYAVLSQLDKFDRNSKHEKQYMNYEPYESPRKQTNLPLSSRNMSPLNKLNSNSTINLSRLKTPSKNGERAFYEPKRSPIKKNGTLNNLSEHKDANVMSMIEKGIKKQIDDKKQKDTQRFPTQWAREQTQIRKKTPKPINFFIDDNDDNDVPDLYSRISESKTIYRTIETPKY